MTESTSFMQAVMDATPGGEALSSCLQCGTCGGSCPSGADMDHTPRRLFGLIAADLREDVLKSNTFWYCVGCYYCMVRCPQLIPITDVMYTLKRMAIRAGNAAQCGAPDFSQTFAGYVQRYGRSFEFGLATRYHLTHAPLSKVGIGALGLEMFSRDRLSWTPARIKDIEGLRAILDKAAALARESEAAGGGLWR